ncbi:MAG: penicillin-binding protein [Lactobacillaceae bacterium]|nr:penicillin-binding protein [Lactobacillaceae bacterium]
MSAVFLFFLLFTFFQIGVLHYAKGRQIATSDVTRFIDSTSNQPTRGTIYSANGEPLAEESNTYDLYAVLDSKETKGYVKDKEETAKKLAKLLDIKESYVLKQLQTKNVYQVEFGNKSRNLSIAEYEKIKKEKIPGIGFQKNQSRFYPNGEFASHLIGYTKKSDDLASPQVQGVIGVEQSYNKYLSGSIKPNKDPNALATSVTSNGDDVRLTINTDIQQLVESTTEQVSKDIQPKQMLTVVMDAKTGAIIAGSQRPSFNGNTGEGLSDMWSSLLYQGAYEPGSTMKTFVLATAANENSWKPQDTFLSGNLSIAGGKITDSSQGQGVITYQRGYELSSNVGFSLLEQKIGNQKWINALKKYGFTKQPKGDFDAMDGGSLNTDSPFSIINSAFGQGITVTPYQLLKGYSMFANDGREVEPYIVDSVSKDNKVVYQHQVKLSKKLISTSAVKQTTDSMKDLVSAEGSTGKAFDISDEGYQVMGKTGTSQIAKNGEYEDGFLNSTFSVMLMAPADEPKYIVYTYIMQPKTVMDNSMTKTLQFVMNPLMKKLLTNIDSSAIKTPSTIRVVPDFQDMETAAAKNLVGSLDLDYVLIGDGDKIVKQSINPDSKIVSNSRLMLVTNSLKNITVPDFKGWTTRDIIAYSKSSGIQINMNGNGFVDSQNVDPGTKIDQNQTIEVNLK